MEKVESEKDFVDSALSSAFSLLYATWRYLSHLLVAESFIAIVWLLFYLYVTGNLFS